MKHYSIIGKKFGYWKVLRYDKEGQYICKCKCGNIKSVRQDSLVNGHSKSCGCYNLEIRSMPKKWEKVPIIYRARIRQRYANYKYSAKRRNLLFQLTIEEFQDLIFQRCYYCGNISKNGFNGIDRVNNKKGYILRNCVPCCDICNHAKHVLAVKKFKQWIKKVYNYSIVGGGK